MLDVADALQRVLERCRPLAAEERPVPECLGLALAEDVASDVDSPPFDKSIVDGYAVVAADLAAGEAVLAVLEQITAGDLPRHAVTAGHATQLMTGAPIPEGADAVVMVEKSRATENAESRNPKAEIRKPPSRILLTDTPRAGQNILRRGQSMRRGEVVLPAGHVVRPIEIGLLSEVGRERARVVPPPRVAILPTGNEIVPAGQTPRGGQIRNTNGPLLAAAVTRAGGVPWEIGVARDETAELRSAIRRGLEADVLVLSGGVSAGVHDLVPAALAAEGVEQVFHKVRFKPGKPLWFGVFSRVARPEPGEGRGAEAGDVPQCATRNPLPPSAEATPVASPPVAPSTLNPQPSVLVFGLPGNPVSSFVCFEMFVRPALALLAGRTGGLRRVEARLAADFKHRGERPTYHPSILRESAAGLEVEPLPWQGSADLRGLARANALAVFPAGDRVHAAGETLEAFWL
jgi:molybdopterin molybdotransferase